MKVYTVHEPPPRRNRNSGDTSRFVFVRDGFHFWAFVFGPLWMLVHRLWLVLLCYAVCMGAVQVALGFVGVSAAVKWAVAFLIALLVGLEAPSLRRWTYRRRKWRAHGVVVARDIEAAEQRFFDGYVSRAAMPAVDDPAEPPATAIRMPPQSTDVIGLFPAPEPRPRS